MLTKGEIIDYYVKSSLKNERLCSGFEFEIFCLNNNLQRIFFTKQNHDIGFNSIFDYLTKMSGFSRLDSSKSVGVAKNNSKFTLEPGSQLEYSSAYYPDIISLVNEFFDLLKTYQELHTKFGICWLDSATFPIGTVNEVPLLQIPRYIVMDKHFQTSGSLGRVMMRNTTSLQMTFSYDSLEDLEDKVNKLIYLKPIFVLLSSNSKMHEGVSTQYRSFRQIIWSNTDSQRCTDLSIGIGRDDRWTLDKYVEKVLDVPCIFDVVNKQYVSGSGELFRYYGNEADIDSYIFHNSTVFPDIRIKEYIEVRYMDNPSIILVPGILILLHALINRKDVWESFSSRMFYEFEDALALSQKLNVVNSVSSKIWKDKIQSKLTILLKSLQSELPVKDKILIDYLIGKVELLARDDTDTVKGSILKNDTDRFSENLETLFINR